MGPVRTVDIGHPDGQLYDKIFQKFREEIFPVYEPRPDGRTSAASNFLIRLSSVRTMGDERPEDYSSTRNFHICNARVRTMIGSRPNG
jgi:hypothetical protein